MAKRERIIDPGTRDFVSDGDGGYTYTTDARTAVYLAIQGERGRWWGDAQAGSRLWELDQAKSLARSTDEEISDIVLEALQYLVDANRISDIEIITERDGQRGLFEVTMRDTSNGTQIRLTELLSTGP